MKELIRTNDVVLISLVESLLKELSIRFLVLDQNMSVLEGSLGVLPRRILVEEDRLDQARRVIRDADIGAELETGG